MDEIGQDTPIMLALCRSYLEKLSPLVAENDTTPKERIAPEELAEAWQSMKEVAHAFDYDSLNYILTELSHYDLPADEQKRLQAIRKAADKLAWDEIAKLI
ncbi:hypothetical protein [Selenomonas sp.]|uniref:hypothetical protein n=1 Tax=Selenomonas sp. TaxID=2053611 RepID=UPI0025EF7605|nr:hypothetical protein [Selenomonas sp.]